MTKVTPASGAPLAASVTVPDSVVVWTSRPALAVLLVGLASYSADDTLAVFVIVAPPCPRLTVARDRQGGVGAAPSVPTVHVGLL